MGSSLKGFLEQKEKSVLFVNSKKAAEELVSFGNFSGMDCCTIIPTSPEALFVLDDSKLPYKIPEDYYSSEEIYNYTDSFNKKIINFAQEIDRQLAKDYPGIGQSGLRPAFYHLFAFIRVYFPLIDAYYKIKKIIGAEKPAKAGFLSADESFEAPGELEGWLLWGSSENIFEKVFSACRAGLPVHSFILPGAKPPHKNYKRAPFQNRPRLYYFLKMLKKDWKFALSRWGRFSLSPLLLLNGGYNWDLCASELYKKGYFIWGQLNDSLENWQDKKNANPGLSGKILHQLEKSDVFRKNFTEEHIDFYPLLKDKISLFLEKVVPASLRAFEKTGRLIEKNRFKGVLFSSNPTAISKSIAHAAKKAGVPVIGWQHGDMNTKQLFAIVLNDLLMSDLFLGWGRGANENRHETACQLKLERKQEIAGSAMLDKLISANPPLRSKILEKMGLKESSQKIIVYATTMYYSSNPYNFSWQHWSDNHLYDTQKRITSRMAGLEGSKIIKLHPNLFYASPAMEEYCLSYKEKNVHTVRSEVSAPELFSIADAIIVDSPSTTLLQAVCRNKPVFCLLRHPKLEGKIIDVLGKRAVLSEDPDRLMREVELFFESGKYKADLNNREFLESYGTNSDCRAGQRAAEAVSRLIKEKYV